MPTRKQMQCTCNVPIHGPIEKYSTLSLHCQRKWMFQKRSGELDNTVEQTKQRILANGVMKMVDFKAFTHPMATCDNISMAVARRRAMKMLTITYSNRKEGVTVGEKVRHRKMNFEIGQEKGVILHFHKSRMSPLSFRIVRQMRLGPMAIAGSTINRWHESANRLTFSLSILRG